MHFPATPLPLLSALLFLTANIVSASTATPSRPALGIRQEPGTPKYECHSNCGTAIKLTKASNSVCDDAALKDVYNKCVACAEEQAIWQYYGPSLKVVGECAGVGGAPAAAVAGSSAAAGTTGVNTTTATVASNATSAGGAGGSKTGSAVPMATEVDAGVVNGVSGLVMVAAVGAVVLAL